MASRPLTEAESRYSNIEHVCLAITYRLEQFDYYLVGQGVTGETDHTPLEHIFKKSTNEAPSRLQRLILRCLRLDVHIQYNHGISIPVANALSRVCHRKTGHNPEQATEDSASQHNIHFITTPIDLVAVESSTAQDRALRLLKSTILEKAVPARTMGVLEDGLVLKGSRIVIPASMRTRSSKQSTWDTWETTSVSFELESQCYSLISPLILGRW